MILFSNRDTTVALANIMRWNLTVERHFVPLPHFILAAKWMYCLNLQEISWYVGSYFDRYKRFHINKICAIFFFELISIFYCLLEIRRVDSTAGQTNHPMHAIPFGLEQRWKFWMYFSTLTTIRTESKNQFLFIDYIFGSLVWKKCYQL